MKLHTSHILELRIIPNARCNKIIARPTGSLVCYLTAPAIDNKANEALYKFLASLTKISQSAIQITKGLKSRNKWIVIETFLTRSELLELLGVNQHQRLLFPKS